MVKSFLFKVEDLRDYIIRFLTKLQISKADAEITANILLAADLRGVDSHGIIRLDTYYGTRLRKGMIDPTSPFRVLQETATILSVDGGMGMGQVVSYHTMLMCIEKARQSGMAMATVRNSNHYGIAGYYAMMALSQDMIGISFTNSQPLVAPTYGRKAMLGTNPIAVAVPAGKSAPYVLDIATSIVPIGRITVYQKAGEEIPLGWGIDQAGQVTSDPNAVLNGGALMPLGGIDLLRGYKGYGLGLMVDIFSGVLSGAGFGVNVAHPNQDRPADVGHFFGAVRVDAFRPLEEFKKDMDTLLEQLKNSPKAVGHERIYIPGEKEFERAEINARNGIPLLSTVVDMLKESGTLVGVELDLQPVGEVED